MDKDDIICSNCFSEPPKKGKLARGWVEGEYGWTCPSCRVAQATEDTLDDDNEIGGVLSRVLGVGFVEKEIVNVDGEVVEVDVSPDRKREMVNNELRK